MADDKPNWEGAAGDEPSKLPPRSGDWQSGLKKQEQPGPRKITADDTVSDFLASSRSAPDSPDWDPLDSEPYGKASPAKGPAVTARPVGSPTTKPDVTDRRGLTAEEPTIDPPDRPRISYNFYSSRTRFTDLLIALVLAVLAFASVATTYKGFGHSWDEALYLKPAQRAAAWMLGVINSGDDTMLRREAVDRHWGHTLTGYDPLHPEVAPVPKLLPGAGLTYLQEPLHIDPMTAMRLPNAVLFGLTVALLFLLGTREYGRIGGFAAAIFYVLMPRVFGHAHIAASETPLAFFTVLTVWCFLVANRWWPFALFTGIALGCAIATKVTALALPVPLMLWGQIYRRRDYASNVFAMAFIAPLVALALWPWLWYDSFARVVNYLGFYLDHQKTAVFYMNRKWGYVQNPVAPITYPLHITALVLPIWLLAFLALGLLRGLFSTITRPVTILFLLMAVFWIGLAMLPEAPRYDGERHWFPAFAFLALLAGGGFSLLFAGVRRWRERRELGTAHRETGYMAAIALVLITVYGAADIFVTHPNELNYYNWITGRASGAYDQGFETSYWGEAVNDEVTDYLRTILKPGDKVKTLALNEQVFDNLRQWGKLPAKVDFSPDEPPYDYAILQVRQGFMGPLERQLWLGKKPLKVFTAGGVKKIMIYDAKAIADVFPAGTADQVTTGTEIPRPGAAATTATLAAEEQMTTSTTADATTSAPGTVDTITTSGAVIAPVENNVTTAAAVRARDFQTTAPVTGAAPGEGPDSTSATAVLDLSSTETVTTSTADVATSNTLPMPTMLDPGTSAPRLYQGELPSTGTLGA
jgi:hypothetical protein